PVVRRSPCSCAALLYIGPLRSSRGRLRLLTGDHAVAGTALPARESGVATAEPSAEGGWVEEAAVSEQRRRLTEREVLAVRVAVEVFRREQLAEVGVSVEDDAHHVERLALEERGAAPEAGGRRQRLAVVEVDAEEEPAPSGDVVHVVDDREPLAAV